MNGLRRPERKIAVLYFAALRERMGIEREELTLDPDVVDVGGLARWLEAHRPGLKGALGSVRFAVDTEFAAPERALEDGAEVALLPPLAGG